VTQLSDRRGTHEYALSLNCPSATHASIWRENGGIAPLTLHLGTRWRQVVSFTFWLLYPWETRERYPLDKKLGGLQRRIIRFAEEKILLRFLRIETRFVNFPDNAVVTILTKLPRTQLCVCAPAIGARHSEPLEQHIILAGFFVWHNNPQSARAT